jgi:hypothetical protein
LLIIHEQSVQIVNDMSQRLEEQESKGEVGDGDMKQGNFEFTKGSAMNGAGGLNKQNINKNSSTLSPIGKTYAQSSRFG